MTEFAPRLRPVGEGAAADVAEANRLYEAGRLEAGLIAAESALRANPELAAAHNVRGCLLCGLHRYIEAVEALTTTVRLDPERSGAWLDLATTQIELENYSEALRAAQRALDIDSEVEHAHLLKALLLNKLGEYEEAEKVYRQTLKTWENSPSALYQFGVFLSDAGRPEEALRYLERLCDLAPRSWINRVALGDAHRALGDLDAAEAEFGKATQLARMQPVAWSRFGEVLLEQDRLLEALIAYRCALAFDAANVDILTCIGQIYERQGATDRAREMYERADSLAQESTPDSSMP